MSYDLQVIANRQPRATDLASFVGDSATRPAADGTLKRAPTEPMNADQLGDLFPPLPDRLLARRREQPGAWLPGARYSLVIGPPSQPAEEISPLGDRR